MNDHSRHPERIPIAPGIGKRLEALGFPVAAVLRHAALPSDLLENGAVSLTEAQWLTLWQATEAFVDDPAFGWKLSRALAAEPFDALSITALSAPGLGEGLERICRFKRVFAFEVLRLERGKRTVTLVAESMAGGPLPKLLVDITFSHILDLARRGTKVSLTPIRILLRRPPKDREALEEHFRCPIEFEEQRDGLILDARDLERPFATANSLVGSAMEAGLEKHLQNREAGSRFTMRVRDRVEQGLTSPGPLAPRVAGELGVSLRTMRRRLADEGFHFLEVVETVRRDLAATYLRESTLSLKEVAFLLGYTEVSSFHRAFHTWHDISPQQWRARNRAKDPVQVEL